jgi:hypothetical protein
MCIRSVKGDDFMRYRPADDPIAVSASNSQPPPSTRLPQHDDLSIHKKLKEAVYALIQRILVCLDDQIRVLGRFVGGRDAGHVGDVAGPGPFVKAFRVPCLAGFNPAFDIAFKIRDFRHQLPDKLAALPVGGDKSGKYQDARIHHDPGYLGDPADVFLAVLRGEAQILVQPAADVVAV